MFRTFCLGLESFCLLLGRMLFKFSLQFLKSEGDLIMYDDKMVFVRHGMVF